MMHVFVLGCNFTGMLESGEAQKLAGRLSWSTQHLFHKLGRAMLRPIFDQKKNGRRELSPQLRTALKWWRHVLRMDLTEHHKWTPSAEEPAVLLVDARGAPARCAAVFSSAM